MTEKKKWLVILTKEQYDWIKDTAESTELKGSDIVREIIDDQMKSSPEKFKKRLVDAQKRIELERVMNKIAELESVKKEMTKELREVTA